MTLAITVGCVLFGLILACAFATKPESERRRDEVERLRKMLAIEQTLAENARNYLDEPLHHHHAQNARAIQGEIDRILSQS
jgi:hypothetical protein